MTVTSSTPIELVNRVYDHLPESAALGRERLGRPLTLAEKILVNHLRDRDGQEMERGRSYADFDPDRVAMQDATAQMALLQFMTAGLDEAAVPSTVHCDHLIQAKVGALADLSVAVDTNAKVGLELDDIAETIGMQPDVYVPSDRTVPISMNEGVPLIEGELESPVTEHMWNLVDRFEPVEAEREEHGRGLWPFR